MKAFAQCNVLQFERCSMKYNSQGCKAVLFAVSEYQMSRFYFASKYIFTAALLCTELNFQTQSHFQLGYALKHTPKKLNSFVLLFLYGELKPISVVTSI